MGVSPASGVGVHGAAWRRRKSFLVRPSSFLAATLLYIVLVAEGAAADRPLKIRSATCRVRGR